LLKKASSLNRFSKDAQTICVELSCGDDYFVNKVFHIQKYDLPYVSKYFSDIFIEFIHKLFETYLMSHQIL
jgi:hypothetical protein